MHCSDHVAGGLLEQERKKRVNESGTTGGKQTQGKTGCKAHVLKIGLIDRLRVVGKQPLERFGHGGIPSIFSFVR